MSSAGLQVPYVEAPQSVLRVVQLTDTHLCQSRGGDLLGMDTDHSLQAVIDLVHKEREAVDLLLATGDLSDNGSIEAYGRLEDYLGQFTCDHYWLPGNHDSRAEMAAAAQRPDRLSGELRSGHWQILMLDSQVPGEVGGQLGAHELEHLEACLASAGQAGLHSLVCLHHQPVSMGSAWLDEQMLSDAENFWSTIERHDSVKGVLWGHVHQECDKYRDEIRLLSSPSTCVQFAPDNQDFKADDQPPGYRWLDLHADGRIETAVSRVWDVSFNVDLDSEGY